MRIFYVAIDQVVPGTKGGSTHVSAVASALARQGHDVHVATERGPGPPPDSSVHWHDVSAPLRSPHTRLLRSPAIARIAAEIQPDAIVERYHNFGGEGLLAARRVGAKAVLEVNAPVVDYPGSPKRLLDRLLLLEPMRRWRDWQCRHADLIVTPLRSILPPLVEPARVLEAEWGADTTRFRPGAPGPVPFARTADEIVAVFAGAFRAWHGAIHFVDAMARLESRGARIRAVLIGDGPERSRVSERINEHRLQRTVMVGAIPHLDMPSALAAADIGVAPFDIAAHAPLKEAFFWSPLKVFEYMATGLPVVAPDMPRLRTLVGHGDGGLLYDSTDPEALAGTIERLADPGLRAALSRSARARAERLYSWDAHCRVLAAAIAALPSSRS